MDALARVEDIPGWLTSDDATKLYELAYHSDGPILEIGTYRGRSAILMALARRDAGNDGTILTLDVDRESVRLAHAEARQRDVADRIVFVRGTLDTLVRAYPHLRPTVVFVDGDHSRAGILRDLAVLESIVPAGGHLLFHDYADPRNDDPECLDTKVRPAVETSWVASQCEYLGAFGRCGLYVRVNDPATPPAPVIDLMALADIQDQYTYRLRYPAAKLRRQVRRVSRRT